jgi:polar amino acid transport system permease protein
MQRVILPQTLRVVLPPLGNEFIALLKDSSLVSILAVSDLLRRGREYASKTFLYFESFTVVALVYLVLTLFFSRLVGIMEERMGRRGR